MISFKKTLIRLLDRPGGRSLLGKISTRVVRSTGVDNVEIMYRDGFWTRRTGSCFFPDSLKFEYVYEDFERWPHQMERTIADAREYWLRHYEPKEGDVVVDVGAGRGEDTIAFSRAVGSNGRVIAIEAHPLSFAILKSFCRLNKLENVTVLNVALMDKPGSVHMIESECSWLGNAIDHGSGDGVVVPADTLDRIFVQLRLTNIAFLKMNIEGAEAKALLGMEQALPRIEQICVACHDFRSELGHGEQFRTRSFVERFLAARGFALTSRKDDPRDYVRDHVFGCRPRQWQSAVRSRRALG